MSHHQRLTPTVHTQKAHTTTSTQQKMPSPSENTAENQSWRNQIERRKQWQIIGT